VSIEAASVVGVPVGRGVGDAEGLGVGDAVGSIVGLGVGDGVQVPLKFQEKKEVELAMHVIIM